MVKEFRQELLEFVLDKIDIVTVVSEFTKLRPAGFYLKGNCPLCKEKKEYFTVHPGNKIYFCFDCQSSGDVIKFISDLKELNREDAAIYLIKKEISVQ